MVSATEAQALQAANGSCRPPDGVRAALLQWLREQRVEMIGAASRATAAPDVLRDRRVLIVEDDATVREVVTRYLLEAGFLVTAVGDGITALRLVETEPPDLVILDRMLPGVDGIEVLRRLQRIVAVPVIMLTALGSPEDRIEGLEAGVDDYVVKPFSPREIVLRVQTVLRRSLAEFAPETPFELGPFRLDPNLRTIWQHGTQLALSGRERDLLTFLLKHPNRVFTREELLRGVWEWEFGDLSTVTVHVRRLREKIETDVAHPTVLVTVWGVGYRLQV